MSDKMDEEYTVRIPKRMWNVDADWGIKLEEERFIEALAKCICGYWNGHTMQQFMRDLGFAKLAKYRGEEFNSPTDFGKKFLYHYFFDKTVKSKFVFED